MDALFDRFVAAYGTRPTYVCRAPGRANLIGEHTDYLDLPVFPMALQRAVRIALRPRDDGRIRLRNVSADFDPLDFEVGVGLQPGAPGSWGNYVMAAARELARRSAIGRGFDGVLASDVLVAAGLSSSSALVNAVGITLAAINSLDMAPMDMAGVMADAERFTGTRGGGMDQAISIGARRGHAARIDFAPLRMRHVPVPSQWRFVLADTGVRAEKSGAARNAYNLRRAECEEALGHMRLALKGRLNPRDAAGGYPGLLSAVPIADVLDVGGSVLRADLLKRFRHVVSEASRVHDAEDAMRRVDAETFGTLMDASHASLRTDFDVSSPELNELVGLAKEGGAAGARLTGAGFGGCIVALTTLRTVDRVLESLASGYYGPRGLKDHLEDRLFVAEPSAGAGVTAI